MQRVTCVAWSLDDQYVMSGSDEMNIRLWKARASEPLGLLRPRQRAALEYSDKLKQKFSAHPEVKRILRHRHLPKHLMNARKEMSVIIQSKRRKYVFDKYMHFYYVP
jgi:WD repeat and SOF domain-containing protein 1